MLIESKLILPFHLFTREPLTTHEFALQWLALSPASACVGRACSGHAAELHPLAGLERERQKWMPWPLLAKKIKQTNDIDM